MKTKVLLPLAASMLACGLLTSGYVNAAPVGTGFTYQGQLTEGGHPANGSFDLQFSLHDALAGGNQVGNALTNAAVGVSNGLFSVTLDFGSVFDGNARWLGIGVRTNGGGTFSVLTPRQPLNAAPYASYAPWAGASTTATIATTATTANTVAAPNITGTLADARLSTNVALLNASQSFTGTNLFSRRVGIGTANPQATLHVTGGLLLDGASNFTARASQVQLGLGTTASGSAATAMGYGNTASGDYSTAMGQENLASDRGATAMGIFNTASGPGATAIGYGTVASGNPSTAIGYASVASGPYSIAMGDSCAATNLWTMAAGQQAKALHQGAFVWADAQYANFSSTANNQFLIRAQGGVGIGKNNPATALDVAGTVTATSFAGSGGALTNVNADQLDGQHGSFYQNAANLASGTLADPRLSTNVAFRSTTNWFVSTNAFLAPVGIDCKNPGRILQIGNPNTYGSLGMIRIASRSTNTADSRVWDIGVPQTGSNTNGAGYCFVIDDTQRGTDPEFVVRWGNGYVGIGRTNPATALDVNGTVTATGFAGNASGLSNVNADQLDGLHGSAFWQVTGNAGTAPGTAFLGTTDNQPLELKVNGMRGLRLEPATNGAPNLIGGSAVNWVAEGVMGATIAGGGAGNLGGSSFSNSVAAPFGTVGGGVANAIQPWTDKPSGSSTIGGGAQNTIQGDVSGSTIGGGIQNTVGSDASGSVIGGGAQNTIQHGAIYTTVGGGYENTIQNGAMNSTIGGGCGNLIQTNAQFATVPGGNGALASNYGQQAYASGPFFSRGDAQSSLFVVRHTTDDAATSELFLDGDMAMQRMMVPTNATWSFDVLVTARGTGGTSAGYQIRGVIENNGGTTALVGAVTRTVLAEDDATWDATVVADDANDALAVTVTGAAATPIRWVASVRTVEVIGW